MERLTNQRNPSNFVAPDVTRLSDVLNNVIINEPIRAYVSVPPRLNEAWSSQANMNFGALCVSNAGVGVFSNDSNIQRIGMNSTRNYHFRRVPSEFPQHGFNNVRRSTALNRSHSERRFPISDRMSQRVPQMPTSTYQDSLMDFLSPIPTHSSTTTRTTDQATSPTTTVNLTALTKSSENNLCVVCLGNTKSYACIPCGHKIVCKRCYPISKNQFKKCPVCRQNVDKIYQIFE